MATANLTDKGIRALKPKATVYRVRDSNPPGFHVVVAPSGTRSFALSFTSPETGRRTAGTLGIYPSVALKDARAKAHQWREQIREGVDPTLEAKRQRNALRAEREAEQAAKEQEKSIGTVAQLFEIYAADMELDCKRSVRDVRALYARDIAPVIGSKKARDVTEDDCADVIAAINDRGAPILANRARGYLIAAFNFGLRARNLPRWRNKAPVFELSANPAALTEKAVKREPRGQRHLSREELRRVWHALGESYEVTGGQGASRRASLDVPTQIAVKLLFATGQRVEEVLHATWDEFDTQELLWTIPATRRKNAAKNDSGEPHLVSLTPFHVALLEALEPYSEGTPYLFPARPKHGESRAPRDHRSISQAVTRLCERTGITRFAPRDIRRTWKTLAGSIGIDLELRNRIQGHAMDDVGSRHYDRYDYLDEKRRAMAQWVAFLEALLADEPGKVVPIRAAR
jgi:integrase